MSGEVQLLQRQIPLQHHNQRMQEAQVHTMTVSHEGHVLEADNENVFQVEKSPIALLCRSKPAHALWPLTAQSRLVTRVNGSTEVFHRPDCLGRS